MSAKIRVPRFRARGADYELDEMQTELDLETLDNA